MSAYDNSPTKNKAAGFTNSLCSMPYLIAIPPSAFCPNACHCGFLFDKFSPYAEAVEAHDRKDLRSPVGAFNVSKLIRKWLGVAIGKSTLGATMITADAQPMSAAPLDGTPIRLFVSAGSVIASFWSEERCQKAFGAGCYRSGWYLLDDDTIELDGPLGWEPLAHSHSCFENDTVSPTAKPLPFWSARASAAIDHPHWIPRRRR
jgi:hypothetical protein